jgi:hypothetical protein
MFGLNACHICMHDADACPRRTNHHLKTSDLDLATCILPWHVAFLLHVPRCTTVDPIVPPNVAAMSFHCTSEGMHSYKQPRDVTT